MVFKLPFPIAFDARIKLLMDRKKRDENLIAIVIDTNNNKETIIIYIIANEIVIPVLLSSTL